jgi:serine/threonine protein kinase
VKVCPNCQSRFDQGEAFCPDDGTELVDAEQLSPGRLAGRRLNGTVELESLRQVDPLGERYRGALIDQETPVDVTVFNQAATPIRERLDELDPTADILGKALPLQILSVHSVELDSDEQYLVEQAADGQSLRELIDEEAPMDWRRVIRLTARLAQALHWMAERGQIHRGLHPGAIHVDTDDDTVQVGDWLQSALTRHANPLEGAEEGQAFVGFAAYVPPEAIDEEGDVDERSLVYSLGMLLYEMILGRPPFTADDTDELLKRQIHENPLELGVASDDGDLHPELDSILGMMWNKDPEERFQTPKAIVAALSSLVDDSPRQLAPAPEVADDPIFETDVDLPGLDEDNSGDEYGGAEDQKPDADGRGDDSGGDTLMGISATDVKEAGPGDDAEESDESKDAAADSADDEPGDDIKAGEAAIEDEGSGRERTSSTDQPSIIIEDPELRSAMDEESTAETTDDGSDEEPDSEASNADDDDAVETGESVVSIEGAETDDLEDEDSDVEAPEDSDEDGIEAEKPDDEATSVETDGETSEESADEAEAPDEDTSESDDPVEADTESDENEAADDEDGDRDEGVDDSEEVQTSGEAPPFVGVDEETASAAILQRTATVCDLLALGFRGTGIDDAFEVDSDTSPIAAKSTHFLRDDDSEVDGESAAWDELSDEIEGDDEDETDGETDDAAEESADASSTTEAEDEQQTTDEPDDTEESVDEDEADAETDEKLDEAGEDDQPADVEPEGTEDSDEPADEDEQPDEEPAADARDEGSDDEAPGDEQADDDEQADEDDQYDEDEQADREDDPDDEQAGGDEAPDEEETAEDDETTEDEDAEEGEPAEDDETTEDQETEDGEPEETGDEENEESSVDASGETVVVDSEGDEDQEETDDDKPEQKAAENDTEDAPQLSSFEADGLPETDATDEWFEVDEKEAWRAANVREGRDRSEIIRKYTTTAVWVVLVLSAVGLFIFAQTYEPADGQNGGTNETQTSSE